MQSTPTLPPSPSLTRDADSESEANQSPHSLVPEDSPAILLDRYRAVRSRTEALTEPLSIEDYVIQAMAEASPPKWHLAHSTWFFERFLLRDHLPDYQPMHPQYEYLFNSYYNTVGPMHCRPKRGLVSRPSVDEVFAYRREIDRRMGEFIDQYGAQSEIARLVVLGLHHEQQHQELLISDVKYNFSANPMLPAYRSVDTRTPGHWAGAGIESTNATPHAHAKSLGVCKFPSGIREIGTNPEDGFCYDHETPRHEMLVHCFSIADQLVTNGEYLNFMQDGGYERHELWLSLGWDTVGAEGWQAPIYWFRDAGRSNGRWLHYTLSGPEAVRLEEPVSHLSYFEADAYARWAGARLPTEAEWEVAAAECELEVEGNFAHTWNFHPQPPSASQTSPKQMFGDLWEWTSSAYAAYPGYRPLAGALGEYNGKFMCNQYVLRGGSCATPRSHMRMTYRNFFPPHARWQFTGLRLAWDAQGRLGRPGLTTNGFMNEVGTAGPTSNPISDYAH